MKKNRITLIILLLTFLGIGSVIGQIEESQFASSLDLNKEERKTWLQDAGFGMFIHFSFDSQLGMVISHSMVGASEDYTQRFVNELPKTFNPSQFSAKDIAILAKLSGMKYVVLTTKHHSGFCLWDTKSTDFDIMNTPYGKDLVAEYVEAVREQDLGVGFYFSPEDFHFLYENGQTVRRRFPKPIPDDVMKKYKMHNKIQLKELMTNYGKIDVMFFDGLPGELQEHSKKVCWELQPDLLVTRGAIETPEQSVPGRAFNQVWEACVTMGTQWQYKPTNDEYKSGTRLIELLIESRAKGGALLLNIGPKPNGRVPDEQEDRLREVAAWHFINHESIHDVRPWVITNEDDIWLTKSKDGKTVFAYLTNNLNWARGERKEFLIKSVQATGNTKVSVLGQSDEVVEYSPEIDATTRFEQKDEGLQISCVRAHRIYNNHKWHNPIVLKIENVKPALEPPFVETTAVKQEDGRFTFSGKLVTKGDAKDVQVGFYFKEYVGFAEELQEKGVWGQTKFVPLNKEGEFSATLDGLEKGKEYQYRSVVIHPKIEVKGDVKRFKVE